MTAPERETAGSVRSAHVAYFLPPDWARIAARATPALERIDRDAREARLLVIVPDSGAALSAARAMAAMKPAAGLRILAATTAGRAQRLLAAGAPQVVIGSPATLVPLLASSALKLGDVATVLFAAADELDADSPELSTVMAEVPRTAARMLTALDESPSVEALLERYLHRARRVRDDDAPGSGTAPASLRYHLVSGSPVEALPSVLDEVDAPSTTVLAADAALANAARALLTSVGYVDETIARVSEGDVPANTALVVTLGVPTAATWTNIVAAQPAQVVAIIAARELTALQRLAGESAPQPFAARGAVLRARAADARMRAELREVLAQGIPSREVLALEPLLGEFDGLEVAAAALRLLERTRANQAGAVAAAEGREREQMKEAQRDAAPGAREERPPRAFTPRGDRPFFGGRERDGGREGARDRGPRAGKPFGARGDKPRGFGGTRDDKPRGFGGARGDKPRGGRPPKPRGDR